MIRFVPINETEFNSQLSAIERFDDEQLNAMIVKIDARDSRPDIYQKLIEIKADRGDRVSQATSLIKSLLKEYIKEDK